MKESEFVNIARGSYAAIWSDSTYEIRR